jgi:hypothetical protein
MVSDLKKIVRANALQLIQKATGPLKPRESGVTRLVALGIANGTAQRILDDASDIQLETVERLAAALKVSPLRLMTAATGDAKAEEVVAPVAEPRRLTFPEELVLKLMEELQLDERGQVINDLYARASRRLGEKLLAQKVDLSTYGLAIPSQQAIRGDFQGRRAADHLVESPLTHNHEAEESERKEQDQ